MIQVAPIRWDFALSWELELCLKVTNLFLTAFCADAMTFQGYNSWWHERISYIMMLTEKEAHYGN